PAPELLGIPSVRTSPSSGWNMFPTRVFLLKKPRLRAPLRMMDNLQHWRNRAADTLARLEEAKDPKVRDSLVRLYQNYVRMVRFEEGRLSAGGHGDRSKTTPGAPKQEE
ncbi:MAG: hypothetical protein WBX25_08690, partial [Rhodomicrobium sp.]